MTVQLTSAAVGPGEPHPVPAVAAGPHLTLCTGSPADAPGPAEQQPASTADQVVTALYRAQYRSLVRMATMLTSDSGTAEEVVQDCFVGMHAAFWRLRDMDKAVNYLRRSVVNRCRSAMRRRVVADRYRPEREPEMPSAEQGALARLEQATVLTALSGLPVRQREAIVLRFYLDLSEEQVASAMNISRGAVKAHTARGKAALRIVLKDP